MSAVVTRWRDWPEADVFVFDKTETLTLGHPELVAFETQSAYPFDRLGPITAARTLGGSASATGLRAAAHQRSRRHGPRHQGPALEAVSMATGSGS